MPCIVHPLVHLPTVIVDIIVVIVCSLSVGNVSHLPSLVVSTFCVVSPAVLDATDSVVAAEETLSVVPVVSVEAVVDAATETPD